MPDLHSIAERLHTGTDSPETSRALVVFNFAPQPLSGVAVFQASMAWPCGVPLPPVSVTDAAGSMVPSTVHNLREGPDAKGRADRVQLAFALCFAVADVPANGWRTYIASYADTQTLALEDFVETPGLTVVETTRHSGDLPRIGNF